MYERAIPATPQRLWEQSYPGTPDQVRHVRASLRQFLADCPVADDAVHLLSELSANAIAHSHSGKSGGTFTVRVQHLQNGYVRGEVEDQGSDWHGACRYQPRTSMASTCSCCWPPHAASSGPAAVTWSGSASAIRAAPPQRKRAYPLQPDWRKAQ